MTRIRSAIHNRRRGVSAAEFAISLPLLIALCLVAFDLGRFAHAAIAVANSVRVGAEYGASRGVTSDSFPSWKQSVESRMLNEMSGLDSDTRETVELTVEVSSFDVELPRVNVAAECTFHTVVDWWMLPDQIQIRREQSIPRFR